MQNHPRRKYTLTAKALAACRANLVKARAVPYSIRFRSTRRRREACRANLLKAHAVLRVRGDRLPGYGTCFRHGLYAVSLERTLALAGERREEYDAHLDLFRHAMAPQGERQEKLAGAVARCTWRLLRALRGQARWELCSLDRRLGEAARMRRGELAGEFARATPLDRDHMLVDELQLILASADEVPERRRLLHQRLERLLRLDVREREGEERARDFSMYVTPGKRDQQLWERVALAMDNPLLRPSYVAEAIKRGPLRVESTKRWGWWPGDQPRPRPASLLGEEGEFGGPQIENALNYELAGRRGQVPPWDASAESRSRFVELFSVAFREPRITGMASVPTPAAELQAAAEACWERLGFYSQRAEEEAARLREILEEACRRRGRGEPWEASQLA